MKKLLELLILLLCRAHLQAQTVITLQHVSPYTGAATVMEPDPKCSEYEHIQHTYGHCASTCGPDSNMGCTTSCLWVPASVSCVDDMHQITERDWQGLMNRLRALESKGK